MLQSGVLSINEVRAEEQLNPIDGGGVHMVQINQIALNKLEEYSDSISKTTNNE